jgi:diguanylate cyclase (GGDEF)-like protein
MKIFQDKGKTILPRVDSVLLMSRLLILVGAAWVTFWGGLSFPENAILRILSATYLITLIIFWLLIRGSKYDLKKPYLVLILFELFFISALIGLSNGYNSDLYLLYYLTVGFTAYLMTLRWTLVLVGLTTVTYLGIVHVDIRSDSVISLAIRLGIIWLLATAISFVSDYIRRSERRFMKLFDTLNQRTSELEKSQAHLEMIYENSRILSGILDIDEVIEGVMEITGKILRYPASGLMLMGPGDNLIYRGRNIGGQNNFHLKAADSSKFGLVKRAVEQSAPLSVVDIAGRKDYSPLRSNTRSLMLVPLLAHGKTVGVLTAESPLTGFFSDKDLNVLSVVARSAAIALENATLHRKMEELTITDELTGVYNYRYFATKLKEEQRRAARYDLPLSMIMLDIDWFKRFNDTYGHEVGNIVLKGITDVVKRCIRDVDIFARYGGEEFVIILPQTPRDEVAKIGERIRQQIEEATFGGGGGIEELKVTVSVGVSSFPENGRPNEELLSVVDQALYRAKGAGKNMVCVI